MALRAACLSTALSSPSASPRTRFQLSFTRRPYNSWEREVDLLDYHRGVGRSCQFIHTKQISSGSFRKRHGVLFAVSEDPSRDDDLNFGVSKKENHHLNVEEVSAESSSSIEYEDASGKPGFVSFYNRPYKVVNEASVNGPETSRNSLLWFAGPAVLVASFVIPSLQLRKLLSVIFEDSLLTDFLILFITEAFFYCGVGVFLFLIDRLRRPSVPESSVNHNNGPPREIVQRISSVAVLVLNLLIPLVTMGLVWPWTGPAASATLAPHLVGIVVQFAFEQYARIKKSPSWPVIPIIFQVYRLYQLNRAAQLVAALSYTVRGAEATAHNLAIKSSLGTLVNVLQCLGLICIWSLSSFLMRFYPSTAVSDQ